MPGTDTIKNVIKKIKSSMPSKDHESKMSREDMISIAAYYCAEQRCFVGGDPVADWLEAESVIDAMLGNTQKSTVH